ncbi:MAG: hypothetical protein AB1716_04535 [Planctomycetota bacterium]
MGLLTRITTHDSCGELETAADLRFYDGLSLATSDVARRTAAVYLLGYVGEVLVKTAYYRCRGVAGVDDVATELHNIPVRARVLGLRWRGNLHNLESLATLLVLERDALGNPLEPGFAAEFQGHVASLGAHWSETLRYKAVSAQEAELFEVFESVEWLIANHGRLWS